MKKQIVPPKGQLLEAKTIWLYDYVSCVRVKKKKGKDPRMLKEFCNTNLCVPSQTPK